MKTSYLLLSSALLLGCLSACNTSPRESKVMEANDGSVTIGCKRHDRSAAQRVCGRLSHRAF